MCSDRVGYPLDLLAGESTTLRLHRVQGALPYDERAAVLVRHTTLRAYRNNSRQ